MKIMSKKQLSNSIIAARKIGIPNPVYKEQKTIESSRKFTVKASKSAMGQKSIKAETDMDVNERIMREDFAEQLIDEFEKEYSIIIPTDTWAKIIDLADDLEFGAEAHKYGSTPMYELESAIYDIIEEDIGVVIGSAEVLVAQDESLIDELWSVCDDIGGLQDIDFDSEDTDGTHIIFIYDNSTNDYDSRETELIEALQDAGYNAEYDASNGSNVIVLRVTRFVSESISVRKKPVTAAQADTTVS